MIRYLLIISLIISSLKVFGQTNQFSQFFATSILINPAFAGTSPEKSISSNYKRSGNSNDVMYNELLQATVAIPLLTTTTKTIQTGGVGLTFHKQNQGIGGIFKRQKILATGAYTLRLDRLKPKYLIFGLQTGLAFDKIGSSDLQWGSQYNKYIGFDDSLNGELIEDDLNTFPVFNFGVVYAVHNHDNIYIRDRSMMIGLSVDNLNQPKTGFFGFSDGRHLPLVKLMAVGEIEISPKTSFHPAVFSLYQNGTYQTNLGAYWSRLILAATSKKGLILQSGIWYRVNDSIIVLLGLQIDRIKTGLSYDFNSEVFSENVVLNSASKSFEISISYDIGTRNKLSKIVNPLF